jgi:hypothetical protein
MLFFKIFRAFSTYVTCEHTSIKEVKEDVEDGEEYDDTGDEYGMTEDEDDREIIDEFEEESAAEESHDALQKADISSDNSALTEESEHDKLMYPEEDPDQSRSSVDPHGSRSLGLTNDNVQYKCDKQFNPCGLSLSDSLQEDVDVIKRSMVSDSKTLAGDRDSTTSDVIEIKSIPKPLRYSNQSIPKPLRYSNQVHTQTSQVYSNQIHTQTSQV